MSLPQYESHLENFGRFKIEVWNLVSNECIHYFIKALFKFNMITIEVSVKNSVTLFSSISNFKH